MEKKVKHLTGTPWHVDFVKITDNKRDRRRCVYYNNQEKVCTEWNGPCHGSSHCMQYKEKITGRSLKDKAKPNYEVFKKVEKLVRPDIKPSTKLIGMKVVQKHQNKPGKIVGIELNKIKVIYNDHPDKTVTLKYPECFIEKLISIEDAGKELVQKTIVYFNNNTKKE